MVSVVHFMLIFAIGTFMAIVPIFDIAAVKDDLRKDFFISKLIHAGISAMGTNSDAPMSSRDLAVLSGQNMRTRNLRKHYNIVLASPITYSKISSSMLIGFSEGGDYDRHGFQRMLEEFQELLGGFSLGDYFPSMEFIHSLTGMKSRLQHTCRRFDQLFDEIIKEHLNPEREKEKHKDLIDVLLDIQKNGEVEISLTMDNVKAIMLGCPKSNPKQDLRIGLVWIRMELKLWFWHALEIFPKGLAEFHDSPNEICLNRCKLLSVFLGPGIEGQSETEDLKNLGHVWRSFLA
ncbi:Cytochrome P450 [Dillenia turbinata]|uniref:Cytochrome P450 n=1 Tax=Dillenia turbinata TaxID=194707 RepID=A0AAN8V1F3_9MAGN